MLSASDRTWRFKPHDERLALALSQRFQLPVILGQLLAARNIGLEEAEGFLEPRLKDALPNPLHLKDMQGAANRLAEAIINKQSVAVWGDYDVDGATSSALLINYFQMVGQHIQLYVPDRMKEGYGPNAPALEKLRAQGVELVITVDCGTTAFAPLDAAKNCGLEVLVIDHHASELTMPAAVAVVNPNRFDEDSDYKHLAAVGVVFLLLIATNTILESRGFFTQTKKPNLLNLLDIVALGTVCDVVSLTTLNRAFVAQGLKVMANRQNLGLKTLMDTAGVKEVPTAYHLGFVLGPRINAGGRVGQSDLGAKLLSTKNPAEAQHIATLLEEFNKERKAIEETVLAEALVQAEQAKTSSVLIVSGQGWHAGVIGIVAGRLKERYHLPTCVIAFDDKGIGKASCRSVSGVHLGNLVIAARQQEMLLAGGGHEMAAGFSIHPSMLPVFTDYLEEQVQRLIAAQNITPLLHLDGTMHIKGITADFILRLEQLAPFGAGNPQPRFLLPEVIIRQAAVVGDNHVRCVLGDKDRECTIKAMAFRALDQNIGQVLLSNQGKPLHIAGTLKLDTWGKTPTPQVFIEDVMLPTAETRGWGEGLAA